MEIITRNDARELGLARYFTGFGCKNGHISERYTKGGGCVDCVAAANHRNSLTESGSAARSRARSKYRSKPEVAAKIAAQSKEYMSRPDVVARRNELRKVRCSTPEAKAAAAQRRSNPARKEAERIRQSTAEYKAKKARRAKERRSDPEIKAAEARYKREKRRSDPLVALIHRLRSRTRGALKANSFKKQTKTEQMLGAPISDCLQIIERQFLPGMGWHNMPLWHLDHIVPLSSATSVEHLEALCRISNVRPMWGKDNRQKNSKITHLL